VKSREQAHEEVRNKQPSVDLKALHFELSAFRVPRFRDLHGDPGGGPSRIVKGLPLRGVAFRITGFPAFWISGDHGAPCSESTGRRPRESLKSAHYRSIRGGT
jgi:hypothetical protein